MGVATAIVDGFLEAGLPNPGVGEEETALREDNFYIFTREYCNTRLAADLYFAFFTNSVEERLRTQREKDIPMVMIEHTGAPQPQRF